MVFSVMRCRPSFEARINSAHLRMNDTACSCLGGRDGVGAVRSHREQRDHALGRGPAPSVWAGRAQACDRAQNIFGRHRCGLAVRPPRPPARSKGGFVRPLDIPAQGLKAGFPLCSAGASPRFVRFRVIKAAYRCSHHRPALSTRACSAAGSRRVPRRARRSRDGTPPRQVGALREVPIERTDADAAC